MCNVTSIILQGAQRRVEAEDWGGALEALAWLADVSLRRIARLTSKVGLMVKLWCLESQIAASTDFSEVHFVFWTSAQIQDTCRVIQSC